MRNFTRNSPGISEVISGRMSGCICKNIPEEISRGFFFSKNSWTFRGGSLGGIPGDTPEKKFLRIFLEKAPGESQVVFLDDSLEQFLLAIPRGNS